MNDLFDERFNFFEKFVVEKIAFLHQGLDLRAEPFLFFGRQLLGGGHDDRDLGGLRVGFQGIHHREPVHFRHHQIQDDQVGQFAPNKADAFLSVGGLQDREIALRLQDAPDQAPRLGRIVHDRHAREAVGRHLVERRQQTVFRRFLFLGWELHSARPVAAQDEFFGGHGVPGAIHHDRVSRFDDARPDQFEQPGKGRGGGRFRRDAFHLCQGMHGAEGFFIGHALEGALGSQDAFAQQGIRTPGVAGRQGLDARLGRGDRRCRFESLFETGDHRRAALYLYRRDGRDAIDQAHLLKLAVALINAQRPHPAADGLHIPIRCAPHGLVFAVGSQWALNGGQLFGDLEGDGLHRLDGCDRARPQVQVKIPLPRKFRGDLFRLVVGACYLDHLAAVQRDLAHFHSGNKAGDKSP
jgi:hypothetical protein